MVRQKACQYAGCTTGGYNAEGTFEEGPFLTDPECSSVVERKEDLELLIRMVHDAGRLDKEAEARHLEAEAKKISA